MNRVFHVVKKEFLQMRRDRRMVGMLFAAPILQLVLLGYAASLDIKNIPMVVCDLDNSKESRELIEHYSGSGYFNLVGRSRDMNDIDTYFRRSAAGIALIVPVNFGRDLLAGRNPQLVVAADGSDSNTGGIGLSYASSIAASYARNILVKRAEMFNLIKNPSDLPQVTSQTRAWYNQDLKSVNFMVPGVLVMVLMLVMTVISAMAIVKEKESGTIEQIVVTPLRDWEFILGKMIPFTITGFIQVSLVLIVAVFFFKIPLSGSLPALLTLSVLFVIVGLGFGIFVSSISKTQQQATMAAQFLLLFPMLILSGFIFPIENMPKFFQYVTYIIPIRYALEIVRGIFLKGDNFGDLIPQTLALLAIGTIVLSLSVNRFRRSLR
ncbi:MAG TPA: ABC transporter permease [Candidatus Kryptonia bacterium]